MSKILQTMIALACATGLASHDVTAATPCAGQALTPVGAECAGNASGTIPPWSGGLTAPPAGWTPQKGYIDPFAGDALRFEVDARNWAEHREQLSPGTILLLQKVNGFKLRVFPTRRSASYPPEIVSLIEAQAGRARLEDFGVKVDRYTPAPFQQPKNGLEAIWNHLMRYVGGGIERTAYAFPVRPSGEYYRIGFRSRRIYETHMDQRTDNRLFVSIGSYTEPAQLLGTTFLVHEPLDQLRERRSAWVYNAGLRRVRRAPDLGYDGIPDGSEAMFTADQIDGYNGAPDRYEWTLLGKKELYVPYNTYRIGERNLRDEDIIRPGSVNPELMRYELHRVWVVEAKLKSDRSHIYGRRVFYLDEDTWSVLIEEAYSTRGDLWRVALHGLVQYYDAQVPWYRLSIYHDLESRSYLVGGLDHDVKEPIRFGIRGSLSEFQPDALRRLGTR